MLNPRHGREAQTGPIAGAKRVAVPWPFHSETALSWVKEFSVIR